MSDGIRVDLAHLEQLLYFAYRGDKAYSGRRLRNWFRKVPVCSDPATREPDCPICQMFTAAEMALAETGHDE